MATETEIDEVLAEVKQRMLDAADTRIDQSIFIFSKDDVAWANGEADVELSLAADDCFKAIAYRKAAEAYV